MTEPLELPVITPGVEEATRKMRDFHGATVASSEAARVHVQSQVEVGHGLQEVGRHTESTTNKMRELGGELRHTSQEGSRLLRDMASEFAPILFAAEAAKIGIETIFEMAGDKAKDAADKVKAFGKAMDEVQKGVNEAGEKKDKGDITFAMKNKDVIGGLTSMGGDKLVGFAKGLASDTGMDIEEVNKAVLSGKRANMSDHDIRSMVQGAALGEKLGQGKFAELAGKASSISHDKTGKDFFSGSDAESLQNLLNAEGLEKWNSEEGQTKRGEQFQSLRKMMHDEDRAKGISPHNFRPIPQQQFEYRRGTSAASLRAQSARQAGTVSESLERIGNIHSAETITAETSSIGDVSREGVLSSLGNAEPAAEREKTKRTIEEEHPGFTNAARAYNEANKKAMEKLLEIDHNSKTSFSSFLGGFFSPESMREKRNAGLEAEQTAKASSQILGIPEGVFVQMAASLKAIEDYTRRTNEKTKAPNQEAAPK